MLRENSYTIPIAALAWLVPLITLGNTLAETMFVQYWQARYLQLQGRARGAGRIAEVVG